MSDPWQADLTAWPQATARAAQIAATLGTDTWQVYWLGPRSSGRAASSGRPRTVLAFATPDSAAAFASANQLGVGEPLRLQALSTAQLLLALIRTPQIAAVIFVPDADPPPAGVYPTGLRLSRTELV